MLLTTIKNTVKHHIGDQEMGKVIAYLRVSSSNQTVESQKRGIMEYCCQHGIKINQWYEYTISSSKSEAERGIDALLESVDSGDSLIVSEISRLGRSLGGVVTTVDILRTNGVRLIAVKEGIDTENGGGIHTKIMINVFALLAEVEKDIKRQRSKEGQERYVAEGGIMGRPKGSKSSKLDDRVEEIKELLAKGVSQASIAKIVGVSKQSMNYFIKTRGL